MRIAAFLSVLVLVFAAPAGAKDPAAAIVIRAGKSDSVNHQLAVEFASAIAVRVARGYALDVQESQGSVENVIDVTKAPRNYLFTAGPSVVAAARHGAKPFSRNPRYATIRALFPIPAQTVQWVVRRDGAVKSFADLVGKSLISGGNGSIGQRVSAETLQALGIERQVQIIGIAEAGALPALAAKEVAAVALAGPYPLPALQAFAEKIPIRLLSVPQPALGKVLASDDSLAAERVPPGVYGLDGDAVSVALPAGVYTTTRMSAATAYALTKAFWTERAALEQRAPAWQAVDWDALATLGAAVHLGAERYYREAALAAKRPEGH